MIGQPPAGGIKRRSAFSSSHHRTAVFRPLHQVGHREEAERSVIHCGAAILGCRSPAVARSRGVVPLEDIPGGQASSWRRNEHR